MALAASNAIDFLSLLFTLVCYASVAGVCAWGSIKFTRVISSSRRDSAMKEQALVEGARARAARRAQAHLA